MGGPNAFEAGKRFAIPAVLIYARSPAGVLMIHRNGDRPGDYHSGKWNGLGGKLEPDESPLEAARREFAEEAGVQLEPEAFRSLGVLTFPNFKAHKSEDWVVFVFAASLTDEQVRDIGLASDEGELHWVPEDELLSLNLWEGDHHFLPLVVRGQAFVGTIWYDGQAAIRHWIEPLVTA